MDQARIILEDTANKKGAHPQNDKLIEKGYVILKQALPVGDYCMAGEGYWAMDALRCKENLTDSKFHGGDPLKEARLEKLDLVGTYFAAVDVKQSMEELCKNIMYTKKGFRFRFERELLRAKNLGVKLYIVIADDRIRCDQDILDFESYGGHRYGQTLIDMMLSDISKYGCIFRFTSKERLADTILECLGETGERGKPGVDGKTGLSRNTELLTA